jgi:hypothetical protein
MIERCECSVGRTCNNSNSSRVQICLICFGPSRGNSRDRLPSMTRVAAMPAPESAKRPEWVDDGSSLSRARLPESYRLRTSPVGHFRALLADAELG